MPAEFASTELLRGRPVVVMHPGCPLVSREAVGVEELAGVPLIGMRSGYVMHRYVCSASPVIRWSGWGRSRTGRSRGVHRRCC